MRYRDSQQGSAEQGFTLPELLIALVLGLTLVGAILSAYLTTLKSSGDNNEQAQLTYNLRASLDLILSDLKRAGGNSPRDLDSDPDDLTSVRLLPESEAEFQELYKDNPFMDKASHLRLWNCNASDECSCVTYSYDLEGDGKPYADDGNPDTPDMNHFGFKLDDDNRLQIRKSSRFTDPTAPHPGCDYTSEHQWEALTEDDITITEFSISYIDNDGNIIAAPQEVAVPGGGRLQERNLLVTISGTKDEFSLTVTGKVRVRNDRYYTPTP